MRAQYPSDTAFTAAATALGCESAMMRALARVEAKQFGAFLRDLPGEPPVVLFERHKFSQFTEGRYDGLRASGLPESCSLISDQKPGGYGLVRYQHARLEAARKLDDGAAVEATSWGLFQLMGFNWKRCGAKSLYDFEASMRRSVDDHLVAFCSFVYSDGRLQLAMRTRSFGTIALLFNGSDFERNGYHTKLEAAYNLEKENER